MGPANRSNDPLQKKKIQEEMDNVQALTPQLVQATKGYLANPNDPKSMDALRVSFPRCEVLIQNLMASRTIRMQ